MQELSKQIAASVDSLSEELIEFIQTLVQTPSLAGAEQLAQEIIARKLSEMRLAVEILPSQLDDLKHHPAFFDDDVPFQDRLNIIGRWRGRKNATPLPNQQAKSLILNGHIDVVSAGNEDLWHDSPWSGKIQNGKLFGRGSCDMKSGLASAIFAVAALQKLGFRPAKDVLIESVIGEESGGVGTLTTIAKGYCADAAIIMEPTQLKLCPVQAGALTFRLTIAGRSIHACMKKRGVSAIEKFHQIHQALDQLERERHASFHSPLYQDPENVAPINIGTIRGGNWHSTVPEEVVVEGRYGVLPGETVAEAKQIFSDALQRVTNGDDWLKENPPALEWFEGQFESGETNPNHPIVKTLASSYEQVAGRSPKLEGVTYGSDLRLFTKHANIPAVLYGPGDVANAHAANEFVVIEEVIQCTKSLALLICRWCGAS